MDSAVDAVSADGPVAIDTYRLLLEKAARSFDRHEADRREPFNLFSVLRAEHDEVNLHSRFLAALLGEHPGVSRENLKDFLDQFCPREVGRKFDVEKFRHETAVIDREWNKVDILIRDQDSMQAVIIENKIWAKDRPRQLARYAEQMRGYRYHVLYLTLDGHEPSEDSAEGVKYQCVSYEPGLRPWLEGCQRRAYEEPELRESLAQYRRLIAKLTGTDFSEAYMNDLKKLCLEDRNLLFVHDLAEAMVEAKIWLLGILWQEIEAGIRKEIPSLSVSPEYSDISEARIRKFVTYQRSYGNHGLYFALDESVLLSVEVGDSIYFGVWCGEESSKEEYSEYAANQEGWYSDDEWPMYRFPPSRLNLKHTPRKQLDRLVREPLRQAYVAEVVRGVSELWKGLQKSGLVHRA